MWAKAVLRPIFKRPGKRQKKNKHIKTCTCKNTTFWSGTCKLSPSKRKLYIISTLKQSINKEVILNHRKQHLLLSQVYHSPFPEFYITNTDPQYVHTYPGYQRVYGSFEKQVQKCYCKYIGWPETIYYLCDYEIFFLPSVISSTCKRRFRTP